MANVK